MDIFIMQKSLSGNKSSKSEMVVVSLVNRNAGLIKNMKLGSVLQFKKWIRRKASLPSWYSNFSFSASEAFRKKSTRTNRIRTKRDRIYVVKRTQTVTNKGMFALNEFALFEHRTKREVAVQDGDMQS